MRLGPAFLLLCAVVCTACDTCGQRVYFELRPAAAPSGGYTERVTVMPGGARVTLHMIEPLRGPLLEPLRVQSSNTAVAQVTDDGHGNISLVSGVPGSAGVFAEELRSGVTGNLDVEVVPAESLAAAGPKDAGPWRVIEGEVVSAAVVGLSDAGVELMGTGKVVLSVDGALTPEMDRSVDGELRQFFSGAPGDGALHAVLGTTVLALPITVVPKDAVEVRVTKTSTQSTGYIELAVAVVVDGQPVHGGQCSWSPSSLVVTNERTRLDRLDEKADRRAFMKRPEGAFTATCTIAGKSGTFSEP